VVHEVNNINRLRLVVAFWKCEKIAYNRGEIV